MILKKIQLLLKTLQICYTGGVPSINSIVDSCNLASLACQMPVGVFDIDQIEGNLILRLSKEGDTYEPIGRDEESLSDSVVVLADDKGIIARPMYKDSKRTMISHSTKNILIITVKYPSITDQDIKEVLDLATEIVIKSSQGVVGERILFEKQFSS